MSFFDVKLVKDNIFIGTKNHIEVITDKDFWKSFLTTSVYVISTTVGTTVVGLAVALVMNKKFRNSSAGLRLIHLYQLDCSSKEGAGNDFR